MPNLEIGCHVSVAGGVWNAPKNAADLGCETFQIFTRPPQGGKAAELNGEAVAKFRSEMKKYSYGQFVVHTPYFINFGSSKPRIYHGSVSVVAAELKRADLLGAKYVMTHLGSFKDLGEKEAFKQTKSGLVEVLEKYEGKTRLLLEIAAGGGNIIGDTFEELAIIMQPLVKFRAFGGICFDTQHAFASGYDLRGKAEVESTFGKFDKIIGLKYLKMSHINDSKSGFAGHRDRHEHLGEGKIGMEGFKAILGHLQANLKSKIINHKSNGAMPLILETRHDKVKADIKILKTLRDKLTK